MQSPLLNRLTASALIAGLLGFSSIAQAAVVNSTGSGNWSTDAIWSGGAGPLNRPVSGDTVNILSGHTVTNDFGGGFLDGTYTINVSGALNDPGSVFRVNGSTISVGSTGSLGGGSFWDLQNGTFTFDDGATVNMATWEQKGTNVFNFNLSASGFNALTPGTFAIGFDGSGQDITRATYNVDMANYNGGIGTIALADFTTDGFGMDNTAFQGAAGLNVNNKGAFTGSYLQWNDATEAIELVVAVPEPSTYALIGGCFALGAVMLRRRQR